MPDGPQPTPMNPAERAPHGDGPQPAATPEEEHASRNPEEEPEAEQGSHSEGE